MAFADADCELRARCVPDCFRPVAQVRIRAAIAQLHLGQLDAAQAEVAPVLDLAPELRIATVTGWLADLDAQLTTGKHESSALAGSLRHQIQDFNAAALPSDTREAG